MTALLRALAAEALKLRRTLALWMVFVAPAVVVALQFFGLLRFRGDDAGTTRDGWRMLGTNITNLWFAFMLPLFIALETALLAELEHGPRTWKHLFALPVPRWTVYAAKLLVAAGCVAAAGLALVALIAGAGHLLRLMRPGLGIGPSVPWVSLIGRVALGSAAALAALALHQWIAVRWASFTAALSVGVIGAFVTVFATGSTLGRWWLWSQPVNTTVGGGERLPLALAVGAGGGVVLAVLGAWDTLRRDVP